MLGEITIMFYKILQSFNSPSIIFLDGNAMWGWCERVFVTMCHTDPTSVIRCHQTVKSENN